MTQHSETSMSDHSEVSVTPPPLAVTKMLEFATNQQNFGFLNLERNRNMLAAPLAALHTMTEMKSQIITNNNANGDRNLAAAGDSSSDQSLEHSMLERTHLERNSNNNSSNGHVANPHGIDHILSRPTQTTPSAPTNQQQPNHLHFSANLAFAAHNTTLGMAAAAAASVEPHHGHTQTSVANSASAAAGLRGFNIAAAAFFQHHANTAAQAGKAASPSAGSIYWPGFQGLVANPMAWRDRLSTGMYLFDLNIFHPAAKLKFIALIFQEG